ncbi:hypothetical protein [Lysinibacillus sp. 54212]|uniref:hypothetical protein n=1 Tax=Lysinibacillus sp. 54212 TaxID=3119829 RepID=UPI002FC98541
MNEQIEYFVEKMEATILSDIVTENEQDLYEIATDLISHNDGKMFADICQAYELVKHHLIA